MKINLFFILPLALLCLAGCSEPDPWARLPKDCEATVTTLKKRFTEAVPCSGPLGDVAAIVDESRAAHEARFGGPYAKLAVEERPNQVFYNGGSIMFYYEPDEPNVTFFMEIYPENLDFEPQAILDFLAMPDMSVQPEAHGSPTYEYEWRGDPRYPSVTADSWVGRKPDKVLRIQLYGPRHR